MKPKRPSPADLRILFPFLALFVILTVVFPRNAKFDADYRKGSPWKHETLNAQFDFPILKTGEQLRAERSDRKNIVIPYYRVREEALAGALKKLGQMDLGRQPASFRTALLPALERIYAAGIVTEDGLKLDSRVEDVTDAVVYIQKGKRVSKHPASEVLRESTARARLLSELSGRVAEENVDSVLRACGVYDLIEPNLEYDAKTTELVNAENAAEISPTIGFVSAGELIVEEGEIVTAEIAQIIDSYKAEYEKNLGYGGPAIRFWLGNALLALVLTLMLFLVIYYSNRKIFLDRRRLLYLLVVYLLMTIAALVLSKHAPKYLYMMPFTLGALYLEAFFKNKVILPVCLLALFPLLIFAPGGTVFFVMFSAASLVAIFTFRFFNQGWMQFLTAAIVFVTLLLVFLAFRMVDMTSDDPYQAALFLFLGSMLSVAGYPLIYLFEKVFNLVSNSRLRELCDTNNPLLRELESVAPGTFQHSLQVMNMADAAARSIDANRLLVRAGALYHDIGKMRNPLCFIENESMAPGGAHYHDGRSAEQSARDIIAHVSDGLALAAQYKLPEVIQDFIRTHHGTSNTNYFYNKYLMGGGDPTQADAFFYKGVKPRTPEQVILMVCDTLEAASRTLKDTSQQAFSEFVERMFATKRDAGQFDEAEITLRDMEVLKRELKSYLVQVYHERVVYPNKLPV